MFRFRKDEESAFIYCIMNGCFETALIDGKRLSIGNESKSDIHFDRAWIGGKLAVVGRQSENSYYFRAVSDKDVWFNGKYQSGKPCLALRDRDAILVRGENPQDWLLLWFRMNAKEMQTGWKTSPIADAVRFLPMEWHPGTGWYIQPENTKSSVYIDGQIINERRKVGAGMTVQAGAVCGVFTSDSFFYQMRPSEPVSSSIRPPVSSDRGRLSIDINQRTAGPFFNRKTLLRDIHIDIKSGEMVLVLGGSGAGKSTFMNAVIGYEKAEGEITYNGISLDAYRKNGSVIGYVPQVNTVREGGTVGMAIRNAAKLKLPESVQADPAELNRRVQHTLEILGLKEKEKSVISKLSGGEKKRVNVAAEYVGDPKLFFLDEPDTGLDTVQGEYLMEALRAIADEGRIVMMITHAPNRKRAYYDKVIVIAKNRESQCGELAFYGARDQALHFFEKEDFEGIIRALDDKKADHSLAFIRKYQSLKPGREGVL